MRLQHPDLLPYLVNTTQGMTVQETTDILWAEALLTDDSTMVALTAKAAIQVGEDEIIESLLAPVEATRLFQSKDKPKLLLPEIVRLIENHAETLKGKYHLIPFLTHKLTAVASIQELCKYLWDKAEKDKKVTDVLEALKVAMRTKDHDLTAALLAPPQAVVLLDKHNPNGLEPHYLDRILEYNPEILKGKFHLLPHISHTVTAIASITDLCKYLLSLGTDPIKAIHIKPWYFVLNLPESLPYRLELMQRVTSRDPIGMLSAQSVILALDYNLKLPPNQRVKLRYDLALRLLIETPQIATLLSKKQTVEHLKNLSASFATTTSA